MRPSRAALVLTLSLAALHGRRAFADATTEAQLRAALQASTAQIAQLEDQVANLQAAQAPEVATIEALRAQLQSQRPAQAAAPGATESAAQQARNAAALAALQRQLAAKQTDLGRLQSAAQNSAAAASNAAAQSAALQTELAALNDRLSGCDAKNARLYALGNQILDAYSHKDDLFAGFVNHEPFTQIKRVQLQNIVQDDQDKLDDNRISASGAP